MTAVEQPLIGPQVQYPTPWRCAELNGDGQQVIVCAEGHYTAEVPDGPLADLIVDLVNRAGTPGAENLFEANATIAELGGQLDEARAEVERLQAQVGDMVEPAKVNGMVERAYKRGQGAEIAELERVGYQYQQPRSESFSFPAQPATKSAVTSAKVVVLPGVDNPGIVDGDVLSDLLEEMAPKEWTCEAARAHADRVLAEMHRIGTVILRGPKSEPWTPPCTEGGEQGG